MKIKSVEAGLKKPKITLNIPSALPYSEREIIRRFAELIHEAHQAKPGPAEWRVELEFFTDEANKAYMERIYELELGKIRDGK